MGQPRKTHKAIDSQQHRLWLELVRLGDTHQRQYLRAYQAFTKGRAQSLRSGVLPGAPDPDLHGAAVDSSGPGPVFRAEPAETLRQQRKQAADAVAPGSENGIGPPIADSDVPRAAVWATSPALAEEREARKAADAAFTALAWPPVTTGEACAAYLAGSQESGVTAV